ncbi:MAG TPA: AMP-binding protein [Verrucomicrobiae bacterium]|nr:AMP-binding protein [Verrucomicrobiae bacterium]
MELTGPELLSRSLELADRYCDAPPSSVVLLLLPHSVELFLLHLGLVLRGRLPAILAWPTSRVDPEKYQRNVLHQLQNLPASQLITLPRLARSLDPGLAYRATECPIANHEKLEESFRVDLGIVQAELRIPSRGADHTPEDALFLQFSGGTTGAQKCVVVTAPMLVNQLRRLSAALQFTSSDGVASWLPMYHDMGLIACFWLPLWNSAPSTQFAATDWLLDPGMLFRLIGEYRATFCWLPNFAFSYLATHKARMGKASNLSHVRAWINCSEPVRERSFKKFAKTFAEFGVRSEQCQASYAMAENVFAVTQSPLDFVPRVIPRDRVEGLTTVDPDRTAYDLLDDHYVSSGRILDGMQVRIRGFDGALCGDRIAGGIEICGESLFRGYWGNGGFSTQSLTDDGWYSTGDYGFTDAGDLYVIGRIKDIIIVAGQNIFPEDVETLVNSIEGVYPGRVVAFGVEDAAHGSESLAVVAEMRGEFDVRRARGIERRINRLISSALGVAPRHVRVVSDRWIIKSTAGKISRRETRQRFLQEELHPRNEHFKSAGR